MDGQNLFKGADPSGTGVFLDQLKVKCLCNVAEIDVDPDFSCSLVIESQSDNVWPSHVSSN